MSSRHTLKDPLTLTVRHYALFILIRPDMGRDLSRGKITASHLEEEMNTEFKMSVVSNFLVSTSSPVRYQKPVKYFCGLYFGSRLRVAVAEDIFFASKNPI